MHLISTNIGAFITTTHALVSTSFGAGNGGNLAATDGTAFHRTAYRPLHLSAKLVIAWEATMASGQTLTIATQMKDSADGSNYDNFGDAGSSVITAADDGSAQKGTVELDVNLVGARDYIRPTITGTLTASGSSTAKVYGVLVLGGGETIPATLEAIE